MIAELKVIHRLLSQRPVFVGFNVTNRCTMRCKFCNVPALEHRDMSLDEIHRVLDQLAGIGVPVVGVTGGEPFLRKDLPEIIGAIADRGMKCTVVTNGELFNVERARELAHFDNIVHFALSVDSLDSALYAELRGKKKLPEILHRYLDAIQHGPKTAYKFNVVLGPENLDEIDSFMTLARANGLFLSFLPMNVAPGGLHRGSDYPGLTREKRTEISAAFLALRKLKLSGAPLWDHRDFYHYAARYVQGEQMGECGAGRLFLDLRSDGKLAFCNEMPHFLDLLQVDKLTLKMIREGRREWQDRIEGCQTDSACCYTCSYNVTATAHNLPAYIWDYFRLTRYGNSWK